jgi:hypothetical protein
MYTSLSHTKHIAYARVCMHLRSSVRAHTGAHTHAHTHTHTCAHTGPCPAFSTPSARAAAAMPDDRLTHLLPWSRPRCFQRVPSLGPRPRRLAARARPMPILKGPRPPFPIVPGLWGHPRRRPRLGQDGHHNLAHSHPRARHGVLGRMWQRRRRRRGGAPDAAARGRDAGGRRGGGQRQQRLGGLQCTRPRRG